MTENELLEFINQVEQEELHQAPDYLKNMILRKANPAPKQIQLLVYSLKTITATAAALIILFTIPQNLFTNEYTIQQEKMQLQQQIQKEKEIQLEKFLKRKEKLSITDFINHKTNYICNQLLYLFEKENN